MTTTLHKRALIFSDSRVKKKKKEKSEEKVYQILCAAYLDIIVIPSFSF